MFAFLNPITAILGKVPWQIWVAAALIVSHGGAYCSGKSVGKQVIIERLEKAEAKAKADAVKAAASADGKQQERATDFQKEQEALGKAIEDARAAGDNPLDAVFLSGG